MDTAPLPLPPESPLPDSQSPRSSPFPVDFPAPSVAHDRDLYCLECGYNLRGLAGDPIRCPECGGSNPVGLIEVPAKRIAEHIGRMENSQAISALGGLLTLPFGIFFVVFQLIVGGRIELGCTALPLLLGVAALVGGLLSFRSLAGRRPGWLAGAIRYYAIASLLAALVIAAFGGAAYLALGALNFRSGNSGGTIAYFLTMVAVTLVAIVVIRNAGPPLRDKLLESIEPMRREIATSLTREYLRSRRHRKRRNFGL